MDRSQYSSPIRTSRPDWPALPPQAYRLLPPRIAIGGIWHETNTFSSVLTDLDAFRERSLLDGDAILAQGAGTVGVLGGVLAAAADAGADLVPTLFAAAMPGGPVTADAHRSLRGRLLDRLRAPSRGPWPLSAVILLLHGAMVAEDEPDAEGALLADVRRLVGPAVPIVAVLDFHANVSPAMVAHADILLAYATYPHIDTFAKGRRAVELALDIRHDRLRPERALRQVPLLLPLPAGRTDGPTPMRAVLDLAETYERDGRAAAVAVTGGFPYADVARAGLAVTVTTNADAPSAAGIADALAGKIWAWRDRFRVTDLPPAEAVAGARRHVDDAGLSGPIVIADTADNPGAGAPGDATTLLRELMDQGVERAAVATIADPTAIRVLDGTPVGSEHRLRLGDRAQGHASDPLERTWTIRWVGDGVFVNGGPIGTGGVTRLGRTVVLRSAGVDVIVCERRVQVLDPAIYPAVGIDPKAASILAIKSSVHYRAGFADLASAMIESGGPGVSSGDLRRLRYTAIRRPIAPLDHDGVFDA